MSNAGKSSTCLITKGQDFFLKKTRIEGNYLHFPAANKGPNQTLNNFLGFSPSKQRLSLSVCVCRWRDCTSLSMRPMEVVISDGRLVGSPISHLPPFLLLLLPGFIKEERNGVGQWKEEWWARLSDMLQSTKLVSIPGGAKNHTGFYDALFVCLFICFSLENAFLSKHSRWLIV